MIYLFCAISLAACALFHVALLVCRRAGAAQPRRPLRIVQCDVGVDCPSVLNDRCVEHKHCASKLCMIWLFSARRCWYFSSVCLPPSTLCVIREMGMRVCVCVCATSGHYNFGFSVFHSIFLLIFMETKPCKVSIGTRKLWP